MILYPEETSWNTLRFDKRNYTIQKAKEQQKEIIKKIRKNKQKLVEKQLLFRKKTNKIKMLMYINQNYIKEIRKYELR